MGKPTRGPTCRWRRTWWPTSKWPSHMERRPWGPTCRWPRTWWPSSKWPSLIWERRPGDLPAGGHRHDGLPANDLLLWERWPGDLPAGGHWHGEKAKEKNEQVERTRYQQQHPHIPQICTTEDLYYSVQIIFAQIKGTCLRDGLKFCWHAKIDLGL
jgi:hypothetical protein